MKTLVTRTITVLMVSVLLVPVTSAEIEEAKLIASDGAAYDSFAVSVSVSGDTALSGAMHDDDNGTESGSAYVWVRSGATWTEEAKLTAGDGASLDWFGGSVSLDGDTAVVGAYGDDDGGAESGSAYVFVRHGTTWTQQAKLTAGDASALDGFGVSVAVSGDTVLVGVPVDNANGYASGSAYVFVRNGTTWTQQAKLTAYDGAADRRFGFSVALYEDTAVVGCPYDDDKGLSSGSVYVFERNGAYWPYQAKLTASDGAPWDLLGISVSLSGDTVVAGALRDDNGIESGGAYVFVGSGSSWTQEAKLTADSGTDEDYFGQSVSVSGDWVLVGAYRDDDSGYDAGSAFLFVRTGTTWAQDATILASDGTTLDYFGWAVSLSGGTAVVGAYRDDAAGQFSGSAYVFRTSPEITPICFGDGSGSPCPCQNESVLGSGEGCVNSTGVGGLLAASGSNLVGVDDLTLIASQCRPGGFGVFFQGETSPGIPFKDGILCVGRAAVRLGVVRLDSAGTCDSSAYSIVTNGHVQAGETRYYQLWFRDTGGLSVCGQQANLTNGLRVDWQ